MAIIIEAKLKSPAALAGVTKLVDMLREANRQVAQLNASLGVTASALTQAASAWKSVGRINTSSIGRSAGSSAGGSFRAGASSILNPVLGMRTYAPGAAAGNIGAAREFNRYRLAFDAKERSKTRAQQFLKGPQTALGANLLNIENRTRFTKMAGQMIGHPLGIDVASLLNAGPKGKTALDKLFGSVDGATVGMVAGSGIGSKVAGGLANLVGGKGAATIAAGGTYQVGKNAPGLLAGGAGFGAGGGAGIASLAAPLAMAVASVAAFAVIMATATSAMRAWTDAAVGGGLSGSRAAATFGGMGIDVTGMGKGLMSGYGPIAAAGAGVNPFGGPFGDNNYNAKGLKVLDWVRAGGNFDVSRRRAEMAGNPDAARVSLLSGDTYNQLRSSQQGAGSMANMRKFEEMSAGFTILMNSLKGLAVVVAGPIVKGLADLFTEIGTALSKLPAGALDAIAMFTDGPLLLLLKTIQLLAIAFGWLLDRLRDLWHWLQRLLGIKGSEDVGKAVERGAAAGAEAGVAKGMREGTFGGGPRSMPSAPGLNPAMQHGNAWRSAHQGIL